MSDDTIDLFSKSVFPPLASSIRYRSLSLQFFSVATSTNNTNITFNNEPRLLFKLFRRRRRVLKNQENRFTDTNPGFAAGAQVKWPKIGY